MNNSGKKISEEFFNLNHFVAFMKFSNTLAKLDMLFSSQEGLVPKSDFDPQISRWIDAMIFRVLWVSQITHCVIFEGTVQQKIVPG